ncbi:MAG: NADPH-dependent F420 reductase [Candidatus Nanopelagicales bacterium]|nr:NADPH-dependent F420 reductase [Candidatus Nanopelagicales bacterium]
MRIGFIGSGNIGSTLARLAITAGNEVVMSNSRGPETLAELVADLGTQASAATPAEAGAAGEIVVVTIPLAALDSVPVAPLAGKVVIDTNNYYPHRDGQIAELDNDSTTSSELLAAYLPQSSVVKAFNSIYFQHLAEQGEPIGTPGRRALPIAGDDAAAKATVTELIEAFGFDTVDTGPLSEGRRFQPASSAYNVRLTAEQLRDELALN